jgi:hypothetical protein
MDRSRAAPAGGLPRWPTVMLTGATHGIGQATARAVCPLVDVRYGLCFDEDTPARPNSEALNVSKQERRVDAAARALRDAGHPAPR